MFTDYFFKLINILNVFKWIKQLPRLCSRTAKLPWTWYFNRLEKLCKTGCEQVSPKIGMTCKAAFEADIRRYLQEVQRSRAPEFGMKRRMGFCRASLD